MPQDEHIPTAYSPVGIIHNSGITLRSTTHRSFDFTFEAVRPGLFRTRFYSPVSHPLPPHLSAPPPSPNLSGPFASVTNFPDRDSVYIDIGDVRATVSWPSTPIITLQFLGEDVLHQDLPFRSYVVDGRGVAHYTSYDWDALHVGLGEKAAPMDLSGRGFRLAASDAFGYDVYATDPLYKHIPLLIAARPRGVVGIFSKSHARGFYGVGAEMDGLWGRYKVYRQDYGGLEEYLFVGRTIKEVVRGYAELVQYPKLVPRWAFGYIAGGMKYSMLDEPRASEALVRFAGRLEEEDIPCSGFQLSSGYTVAETEPKTRNVFTWNRHRFPDPEGWLAEYHRRGIRVIANVKPYVLENHPEYQKLKEAGALFRDGRTGASAVTRLWSAGGGESGEGGHIDFTSAAGFRWWYDGIQALRKAGVDCMWNDNNEYTIPSDRWRCSLDGLPQKEAQQKVGAEVGLWGRALQTELMAKSSHDALVSLDPKRRPFVLTRSATAGTMRYACSSWSGDNVTSWAGMKGANAISLNAGMSLLQVYGHDIGGFEGQQPSPELLVRWVQLGIYSPRFAINCYKTSPEDNSVGDVIEPWMYPDVTHLIRAALKRRYELIPYIYSLALESHLTANPAQRWIGWGYEHDPEVWTSKLRRGEEQYWFGNSLLVGGIYEPDVEEARIYLPKPLGDYEKDDGTEGFINLNHPHQYFAPGQWVTTQSIWKDSIPLLAKIGGAIPVGLPFQTVSPGEDRSISPDLPEDIYRGLEIFPPKGSSNGKTYESSWYEDDGISAETNISAFRVEYSCTESQVLIEMRRESGSYTPVWTGLHVILAAGDTRILCGKDGRELTGGNEDRGRRVAVMGMDWA